MQNTKGRTLNWLIVEDEADIRNLVAMMCQVWGNTPMAYESGQKAWEWLDSVEAGTFSGDLPDFALMDIRMPGKRGHEISARIRQVDAIQDIPIVLMTAFVLSEEEMEKMKTEYGVDEIINKPLPDFDRLRVVLYDIIERKQKENAARAAGAEPTQPTRPANHTPATQPETPTPAEAPAPAESDTSTEDDASDDAENDVTEPEADDTPAEASEDTNDDDDAEGTRGLDDKTRPSNAS
jgi:CheY-like chemotaxis protein